MPAVLKATPTTSVLERIEEAIEWAMVNGLWIRLSDYGIRCVSSLIDARWERDPMSRAVSPLGCAVLMHQPEKLTAPEAAAAALDISLAMEAGIADGLALAPRSPGWMRGALSRPQYERGWEFGACLRIGVRGQKYGFAVDREDK
jgi:hypothetical protein